MWKNCFKVIPSILSHNELLLPENLIHQQIRTTFVLKRRTAPMLHKKDALPKRLKNKHFIYELVQDTDTVEQPNIDVILTAYVEGVGIKGEKVSLRPNYAYNKLLLPGLAVYATPENIEQYKKYEEFKDENEFSSPTAQMTVGTLSRMKLSVVMNKEMTWTLKPWHIKASFRKCGYHVPEEAITMPLEPIQGPNMDFQDKEFFVTVVINKKEKVQVCCRIHHWSTSVTDRIPYEFEFWKKASLPIFSDQIDSEVK